MVGEKLVAGEALDQCGGTPQVMRLTGQKAEVDQIAERVRQSHDLCRYTNGINF